MSYVYLIIFINLFAQTLGHGYPPEHLEVDYPPRVVFELCSFNYIQLFICSNLGRDYPPEHLEVDYPPRVVFELCSFNYVRLLEYYLLEPLEAVYPPEQLEVVYPLCVILEL